MSGVITVIVYVVLWGYVIYAIATYDEPYGCDTTECEKCPFPCDKHKK